MKIPLKTVTVTLSDPEGDAVFVFERLRENERERLIGALADAKAGDVIDERKMQTAVSAYKKAILGKCRSITNLYEGDRAVTAQDVHDGNLYTDVIEAILAGFHAALAQRGEAESKNEDSLPEPSSDSD